MAAHASPTRLIDPSPRTRAQALVELALVMPLLVGIITVLLQFGILFIAYLSIVHETRDVARFAAVNPDTIDGLVSLCANAPANSLKYKVCAESPSVVNRDSVTPVFTPPCATLTNGHCTSRGSSAQLHVTLTYDASAIIFLPNNFRLGPWLNVAIPASLPAYDYYVMVEPH